jgi:hypothetical protein
MTPACAGVVHDIYAAPASDTFISVASAVLRPTTTVVIRNALGAGGWAQTRVVLDEEGRRELIELLGGTP